LSNKDVEFHSLVCCVGSVCFNLWYGFRLRHRFVHKRDICNYKVYYDHVLAH